MEKELIKICKEYKTVIISWILLIGFMIVFGLGYLDDIDVLVQVYIHSLISQPITLIMKIITFFGSGLWALILCTIYILIDRKKGIQFLIFILFVMLCNQILKISVARLRPPVSHLIEVGGYSFPSFHAMISFSLFGYFAYKMYNHHRLYSFFFMFIVMMIGVSRIYLGVHYFSDIVGGYFYAFALLSTFIAIVNHYKNLSYT